jgi:hypothetical protein
VGLALTSRRSRLPRPRPRRVLRRAVEVAVAAEARESKTSAISSPPLHKPRRRRALSRAAAEVRAAPRRGRRGAGRGPRP